MLWGLLEIVFGIPKGIKTVLYVPTYRESDTTEKFEMIINELSVLSKSDIGENWIMLIRIHPKMREKAREIVPKTEKIVDVSLYPDIQELMVVADALITDYSSAVFDFILTYKPGFIYAINEQRYDIERGLYYPLTATPFTVARNNEELERNIINFDAEEYSNRVTRFFYRKRDL